ncbi:MAG: hypothetical protein JL50_20045 [Peptococcaceae bacterium BICA1-7]|nr:MAG: hypothetical protein JL50_20045 [Peptococcaceae bacterium BICA1-7]HBV98373.1 hypothetical protein [Desulfotomaculum sp.]
MSACEQIKSSAQDAILELETEIVDLEEKIETYKFRIQNAQTQIHSLRRFLTPEESGQGMSTLTNGALTGVVAEMLSDLYPQSVHYKDLTDLILQNGNDIPVKQPEKAVLSCLSKLTRSGSIKSTGKGYYESVNAREKSGGEEYQ